MTAIQILQKDGDLTEAEKIMAVQEIRNNPEALLELNKHLMEVNKALNTRIQELERMLREQNGMLKSIQKSVEKSHEEGSDRKRKKKPAKKTESEAELEIISDEEMQELDLKKIQKEQRKEKKEAEGNQNGTQPHQQTGQGEKKIPPIVIKNANDWTIVSNKLRTRKIAYNKAKMTGQGVAVNPSTAEDYRALTKFLNEEQKEFHTYSLPEDKKVRAVIGRLPSNVTEEQIKEDLAEQGIRICSAQRMKSRVDKRTLPLVLVQVEREDKEKIFAVRRCCDLIVKVEAQKQQTGPVQCHRCQQFGHAQRYCSAKPKCVKCGENHLTQECKKARNIVAKCANCGGPHPASYRGCKKVPQAPKAPKKEEPKRTLNTAPAPPSLKAGTSYADAAKTAQNKNKSKKEEPVDFQQALKQMQTMYSAMSAFFANLPRIQV